MQSSRASDEQQQPQQPDQPADSPERDLDAELARMEDRFKRAAADLDNYRKRTAREIEHVVSEREHRLLLEWLEVVDGLDRALAQKPEGPLHEGLRAVRDQVESILERHGLRRVGEPGEPFDPNRHEAVGVLETDNAPDRTVVEVVRSGFTRGDRILRPAQVIVARAPQRQH
jgi:molecular chaperone GrpE